MRKSSCLLHCGPNAWHSGVYHMKAYSKGTHLTSHYCVLWISHQFTSRATGVTVKLHETLGVLRFTLPPTGTLCFLLLEAMVSTGYFIIFTKCLYL